MSPRTERLLRWTTRVVYLGAAAYFVATAVKFTTHEAWAAWLISLVLACFCVWRGMAPH